MRILTSELGGEWQSVDPIAPSTPDAQANPEFAAVAKTKSVVDRLLTELILSENLIALAGLGTSLGVVSPDGTMTAPTMKDLWNVASEKAEGAFEDILRKVNFPREAGENFELLMSHCHISQQLRPDSVLSAYIQRTELEIFRRCRFAAPGMTLPIHETFLRKIARRSTRRPRFQLFTTNYDLCFETAASNARFVVTDGFSHSVPPEFDPNYFTYDLVLRDPQSPAPDYIPNVFQLLKLHGSVDWAAAPEGRIRKRDAPDSPLIIYPRQTKFETSYRPPFIEMMSRFQMAIRQPNTGLLIVGFGFNDDHLVEPILSAIRANIGLRAVVVSPNISKSTRPAIIEMTRLIKLGDSRITLVECSFEQLVRWLPTLVATTESELHLKRFQPIGTVQ